METEKPPSNPIHPDFWKLIDDLMPYMESLIVSGSVTPFCAYLGKDKKTSLLNVVLARKDGKNDFMTLMESMKDALRKAVTESNAKATSIFYTGFGTPPNQNDEKRAVIVALDSIEGQSISLVFAFEVKDGSVSFMERWYIDGDHEIFSP